MSPDDQHIERWSNAQHNGISPHGIKITHIPSGIEACVDHDQSQFANREIALSMIKAAITHPRFSK
jgi:protein subunit release factor A